MRQSHLQIATYVGSVLGICSFLAVLQGCGGASSANVLTGTILGKTFTIPAGTTRTVSGVLRIDVTDTIDIEGDLILLGNADIGLRAPNVTFRGSIKRGAVEALATRGGGFCEQTEPFRIVTSNLITGRSDKPPISIPSTSSVLICTEGSQNLKITGGFTGEAGRTGEKEHIDGCNGASIEIGTPNAISSANGFFSTTTAQQPKSIIIDGEIDAGRGGYGWDDETGTVSNGTLVAKAGNGGRGGDMTIITSGAISGTPSFSDLYAGSGGTGGQTGNSVHMLMSANGTSHHKDGQAVIATSGSGGDGGDMKIVAAMENLQAFGGQEGQAGDAGIHCGRGYDGGAGGPILMQVGIVGKLGLRGKVRPPRLPSVVISGGEGGDSLGIPTVGGHGGDIHVRGVNGAKAAGTLTIADRTGGNGAGSCSQTPAPAGTAGGNGGNVFVVGMPYTATGACNGGNGKDGNGPGTFGIGGSDDAGKKIGKDGVAGSPCGSPTTFTEEKYYPVDLKTRTYSDPFVGAFNVIANPSLVTIPGTTIKAFPFDNYIGIQLSATNYALANPVVGVQTFGTIYYDNTGKPNATVLFDPPKTIPEGLQIGKPVTVDTTKTQQAPGGPPNSSKFKLVTTLVGFETVTAGGTTYLNCARIHLDYVQDGTIGYFEDLWFAPSGIGLVQYNNKNSDMESLISIK